MKISEEAQKNIPIVVSAAIMLIILASAILILCACTVSFNNIKTSGQATDVLDEDQEATGTPTLTVPITVPVKAI